MRRRLWWQISILDRQASIDRGSDPVINANSYSTPLPLQINDQDIDPHDFGEVAPRQEFTETTLGLMAHEIFDTERRLNYVPAGEVDIVQDDTGDPWAQRRALVISCQQRIEHKYLRYCNAAVTLQRYTKLVADIMIGCMWLFAYRPLQKRHHSPTVTGVPMLPITIEILEKIYQISTDPSIVHFRWISSAWVQWHAVAVMIAELCVQTEGPTVERAWAVLNAVFDETAQHVADSDKGRLWRPIKKLMHQAQAVRRKHLEDTAAVWGAPGRQEPLPAMDQPFPWAETQVPHLDAMETMSRPTVQNGISSARQYPDINVMDMESVSADFDQWLNSKSGDQTMHSTQMSEMAWINWETFIEDFQAHGDSAAGPGGTIPPIDRSMW